MPWPQITDEENVMLLRLLRNAVDKYMDYKVKMEVTALVIPGPSLTHGEEFNYNVKIKNAMIAKGGVRLKNLYYHVYVSDSSIAEIKVPLESQYKAYSGWPPVIPPYEPPQVHQNTYQKNIYLYPVAENLKILEPGEVQILNIVGRANLNTQGGNTEIKCEVFGDIDLDWIFPTKQKTAAPVSQSIPVAG